MRTSWGHHPAAGAQPYGRAVSHQDPRDVHAKLLSSVGLLKVTPDDAVVKETDLRFAGELVTELKG